MVGGLAGEWASERAGWVGAGFGWLADWLTRLAVDSMIEGSNPVWLAWVAWKKWEGGLDLVLWVRRTCKQSQRLAETRW